MSQPKNDAVHGKVLMRNPTNQGVEEVLCEEQWTTTDGIMGTTFLAMYKMCERLNVLVGEKMGAMEQVKFRMVDGKFKDTKNEL